MSGNEQDKSLFWVIVFIAILMGIIPVWMESQFAGFVCTIAAIVLVLYLFSLSVLLPFRRLWDKKRKGTPLTDAVNGPFPLIVNILQQKSTRCVNIGTSILTLHCTLYIDLFRLTGVNKEINITYY